jgi:hypothetical protein
MNSEWHREHRLPRNASKEERLAWHKEHARVCACRPPPPSILAEIKSNRSAD